MGLFGGKEQLNLTEPGNVTIAEHVAASLPDVGEYFLTWVGEPGASQLVPEVDAVRAENGWVALGKLRLYTIRNWKLGPLTLLNMMTVRDHIAIGVWASYGLGRGDTRAIESQVRNLLETQGHAAAATWAIGGRPNARSGLDVKFLAQQLRGAWEESTAHVTNGDLIKSFRKWQR